MRALDLFLSFHAEASRSDVGSPKAEMRAAAQAVRHISRLTQIDDEHRIVGTWAALGKASLCLPAGAIRAVPIDRALEFVRSVEVAPAAVVIGEIANQLEGKCKRLRRPEMSIPASVALVVALVDHFGLVDFVTARLHDGQRPGPDPSPDLRKRYPEVTTIDGQECVNVAGLLMLLYDSTRPDAPPTSTTARARELLRRFGERASAAIEAEKLVTGRLEIGIVRTQEVLNRAFKLADIERRLKDRQTFEQMLEAILGEGASS